MSKRKIMTIEDLYSFCLKNNFNHFNSSDCNEEMYIQLPATFESEKNEDKNKEGLIPFVAKAYHDHINLNKSEIKPEVLESTLPSAMLRPILASIVVDEETGEKDFGSHDFSIEEDEDGNEIIRYIEQPVGVIFGDNTIEYDEEDDVNRAILHGYLFDGYCQDAVDIMHRRKTVDCSVELSIREMSFNAVDKVLTLDDFYVSGLTLLGACVKPGMKGSQVTIEDFCEKENSMFSHNDKLIEMLEQLNTKIDNLSNLTIQENNSEKLEEGGKETVKFEELLTKYGKTVEDVTFEYENLSDEELEAKFAEVFGEENTDGEGEADPEPTSEGDEGEENSDNGEDNGDGDGEDPEVVVESETNSEDEPEDEPETEPEEDQVPEEDPVVVNESVKPEKYSVAMSDGTIKEFALTLDEINNALYMLVNETYGESDNAWYSVQVYEDGTLIMSDWWNGKYFRQSYKREEDNFSLVGDRVAVKQIWVTDEEETSLNEMRSNYASLVQFKEDTEKAELHAQREAILNNEKYSVLTEKDENNEYKNEAYAKLVSEMDNYSISDLEKELKSVFADYITNGGQFAYTGEPEEKSNVSKKLFAASTSKKTSRYGNLFNK